MEAQYTKRFNTTGPCVPNEHYLIPVLPRLPSVEDLVTGRFYFILHAPRQSGKTTFLDSLTDKINNDGTLYALNCSLATLRNLADAELAMVEVVSQINKSMRRSLVEPLQRLAYTFDSTPGQTLTTRVNILLNCVCENLNKGLVIFFDEADCLHADPLIPFLAQIRDGFNNRHKKGNKFPESMALA